MQRVETESEIQVAIVDETYFADEEDGWEARSEKVRQELEREFGLTFEEADIGPSVSLPAFVTFLTANWEWLSGAAFAIFFDGKRIEDSWRWWVDKAKMLRSFGKQKQVKLNRNGAAILAVEGVLKSLHDTPSELKMLRYAIATMADEDDLKGFQFGHPPDGPVDTLFLGFTKHIFEIQADEKLFRVGVDGLEVELIQVC